MKRTILFLLLINTLTTFSQNNFWEDQTIVDEGKEPARAYFVPNGTMDEFWKDDIRNNSNIQFLNGTWKFLFADKVANRPVDYFKTNLDESGWSNIQVPGSWEMQGFGVPV
ncbi:MAG TPA: hypothetical protein PLB87_12760, partial [Prolixibacteraceae bacterium]|nr:hypothetical protein [Prolixibacteraceae bacterium]